MAKVILVCGRLCCGKTTYAKKLRRETGAIILSVDELMLSVFGRDAGGCHDEYAAGAQAYLYEMSAELAGAGVDVILDWGFWTAESRSAARNFFRGRGVSCELHYIDVDDETWRRRIMKRNEAVVAENICAYYVDEGLMTKFLSRFCAPKEDEADIVIRE